MLVKLSLAVGRREEPGFEDECEGGVSGLSRSGISTDGETGGGSEDELESFE